MPISKFPELQGALFPSDGAMELAEKRVLTKRAAKERQEEAARQQQAVSATSAIKLVLMLA